MPITKYFAMDEFQLTETGYGWLVFPVALAVALASLFAGKLGDRWGKTRSVRLGIGITAAGMWAVTVSHVAWELMAAAILLGVGFVIAMPAWLAFVADISAPRIRGTIIGTLGGAQGIGAVIGASLGSYLYWRVDLVIRPAFQLALFSIRGQRARTYRGLHHGADLDPGYRPSPDRRMCADKEVSVIARTLLDMGRLWAYTCKL